jgi:hypothetical protein
LSGNISLTVPATSFPLTVRHQGNTGGTNGQLDGLDDRLFAAYLRNGSIWTAHNIGVNNTGTITGTRTRNGSRWYEIGGVSTATPTVAQSGTLFTQSASNDFDQRNYWIPSVMVSGQGHMAMGFSTAGTSEFANAGTAGRLASDALGTLRASVALTTSATAYNPPGDSGASGARRWGDYSYTSLDPCDNMTMWTIQEFCDATNSYAVRVVKLLAPPPATPVSASPSSIASGQASVNVTITGTQIDGSAFFDPGAGFSCRPGASITGGITVNSVTVNSATSVTLNISTLSATDGARDVTINNPDGQSRTGTGLFTITGGGGCSFSINPTSQSFSASGGTGSVSVTAGVGCAWAATSNDGFITVTSGSSGSGNGTVNFSVAANGVQSPRTGTITIAGQTFTVNQQAASSCTFTISPTSQVFPSTAGSGTVNITTQSGCAWTAQSNNPFITLTSAASGSGNGFVNFAVAANSTPSIRTGTITVAGQTFTVTQAPNSCVTSVTPSSRSFTTTGGTGAMSVAAATSCNWTSLSNVPWVTITSGGSGPGTRSLKYTVASNPGPQRTGQIIAGGFIHTVIQAGTSCSFTLNPTSQSFSSSGGTGSVGVTTATGCNWTAVSNSPFITVTSGSSGSGSGTVNYSVAANGSASQRTGTITIAGQTFTVTQAGATGCSFSINPTSQSFAAAGGSSTVAVTAGAGCNWTAVSNDGFITVTGGSSGSGNGTVNYSVAANASASQRTGTITIAGQTFTVTQAGTVSCSFSINPTSQSFAAAGGNSTVAVTTGASCNWTAVSNAAFITITAGSSGTGNGTVSYSVAANSSTSQRTGTMTIAGQTFTVTQAGAATGCTFTVSPLSASYQRAGGGGTVNVTTAPGCSWTAVSNVPWITVTVGSAGTGNGLVGYTVAANTTGASRTGTVTIAGKTLTVKQAF